MFLPHPVLQSFDQLHFKVLPHAPRILAWTTSVPDCQLRPGTQSSPSRTANYNLALGCHLHTPEEGIDPSRSQGHDTDVHEVTPHRLTIVGEPEKELSPVHYFLLTSMVILHHIGGYPVRHTGHHRM